jgi:hypothetical protein
MSVSSNAIHHLQNPVECYNTLDLTYYGYHEYAVIILVAASEYKHL